MKAKDTVIKVAEHSESIWCPHCGGGIGTESQMEGERETQAEITWPIAYEAGKIEAQDGIWDKVMGAKKSGFDEGKQEGIRKVVAWIKEVAPTTYHVWDKCLQADERNDTVYAIFPEDLEDKLKEWGDRTMITEKLNPQAYEAGMKEAVKTVQEMVRLLSKVVPADHNSMIKWVVKSQDSVYTNAATAHRIGLDKLKEWEENNDNRKT